MIKHLTLVGCFCILFFSNSLTAQKKNDTKKKPTTEAAPADAKNQKPKRNQNLTKK